MTRGGYIGHVLGYWCAAISITAAFVLVVIDPAWALWIRVVAGALSLGLVPTRDVLLLSYDDYLRSLIDSDPGSEVEAKLARYFTESSRLIPLVAGWVAYGVLIPGCLVVFSIAWEPFWVRPVLLLLFGVGFGLVGGYFWRIDRRRSSYGADYEPQA